MLFAESPYPNQFGYDEEDALTLVASQLSSAVALLHDDEAIEQPPPRVPTQVSHDREIRVRHYRSDD